MINAGKRAKQDAEETERLASDVKERMAAREARLAELTDQLSKLEAELKSLPAVETPEWQCNS